MENQLRLVVHFKNVVYEDLIINTLFIGEYMKEKRSNDNLDDEIVKNDCKTRSFYAPKLLNARHINSYAVSAYVDTLKRSHFYRRSVIRHLLKLLKPSPPHDDIPVVFMKLRLPKKQFLDYRW